jgi:hypothetical protein
MKRRSMLSALPLALAGVAGCLGGGDSGFANTPENGDATPTVDEALVGLRENLEERGVDVLTIAGEDGQIVVEMQTSGTMDEDIRRVAGGYATVVARLERPLSVRVEDRGLLEETFEIEPDWAAQFANDRLGDQDYLDRINGTRSAGR